jgi:hypothetical protein
MSKDYTARGIANSTQLARRAAEEALIEFERQQEATVVYDAPVKSRPDFPWQSSLISRSANQIHQAVANHTRRG